MKKQKKKTLYIGLCALGGCLIGFFANHLNSILGIVMFSIGVFMLTISTMMLMKI